MLKTIRRRVGQGPTQWPRAQTLVFVFVEGAAVSKAAFGQEQARPGVPVGFNPLTLPVQGGLMPPADSLYHRYHIETQDAPEIAAWPPRFQVKVKKHRLAWLLLKEIVHHRGDKAVVTSRPCVYGVFSGPIGGFAPRPHLCVGCLRCTTQYPDVVQILPHPERQKLGDAYFTPQVVDTVAYEARTGRVPVRGAGYRGKFGGPGWDGMWTDMSEIVRPTRDGIHGREYISTLVDIGARPPHLTFGPDGEPVEPPQVFAIPLPLGFDQLPRVAEQPALARIVARAAQELDTLALLPVRALPHVAPAGPQVVPVVHAARDLDAVPFTPRLVELARWEPALAAAAQKRFPQSLLALRLPYGDQATLAAAYAAGVRVFHLVADYHGRLPDGRFVMEGIREAHAFFVRQGVRDAVTLLGSGGIIAAEHVPKAIILGLDAVLLDTPVLVALQARFRGTFRTPADAYRLPRPLPEDWGVQRLKNLAASWRDQLLEVLGAMGLRDVRRLRGEMGRAMFQQDLEREAFGDIEGFPSGADEGGIAPQPAATPAAEVHP